MTDTVLIGRGKTIGRIPLAEWEQELRSAPEHIGHRLEFMSDEHHQVRYFVVRELPRLGRPVTLREISRALRLSPERTSAIVEELERNLFFLVRRGTQEEVSWAFPVTVEGTGHRLVFSTGERLDAA